MGSPCALCWHDIKLKKIKGKQANISDAMSHTLLNVLTGVYCHTGAEAAAWLLGYCATEAVARRTLSEAGAASALMPVRVSSSYSLSHMHAPSTLLRILSCSSMQGYGRVDPEISMSLQCC
jgi:hypothetical protein